MRDAYLLVSDPPFDNPDPVAAAAVLGVSVAEGQVRVNCPLPEIWLVGEDRPALQDAKRALADAHARTRLIRGNVVATVPGPRDMRRFEFATDALVCDVGGDAVCRIPYAAVSTVVVCRPKSAAGASSALRSRFRGLRDVQVAKLKVAADASFVDLYAIAQAVLRVRLRPGSVDFSGLGDSRRGTARQNVEAWLEALSERFPAVRVDRRLWDAAPLRPRIINGQALPRLLGDISPVLAGIDGYDLMSRLAFLTRV